MRSGTFNQDLWRKAEMEFCDEPLDAVSKEQVICSSKKYPWHGISVWQQISDSRDLYIPPAGKHSIIVRNGQATGLLQRHGNLTHVSKWMPGEVIILPANTTSFWCTELPRNNLHLDISPQWLQKVSDGESDGYSIRSIFSKNDQILAQIVRVLLNALDSHTGLNALFAESMAISVAIHLIENYKSKKTNLNSFGLTAKQIKIVENYVIENLSHDISIEQIAAELGMSVYHFARCFKKTIGLTPYQFVLKSRMIRSRKLLLETNQKIIDIAIRTGFNSSSHFASTFSRYWGVNPRDFRKNNY